VRPFLVRRALAGHEESPHTEDPDRPAVAEVSGAYQGPKGREATEPVGANFHHQPAHGNISMSANETAARQVEYPHNAGRTSRESVARTQHC
jgi:hypothetical protein